MKFSELSQTYGAMRVPSFSIRVGGSALDTGPGARLVRAECTLTAGMEAGALVLEVRLDPEGEAGKSWLDALQPGVAGTFSLGWEGTNTEVFTGLLWEMSWSDPLEGGALEAEAVFLDAKGKLELTSLADAGAERKLSQLVQTVLDASGASSEVGTIPEDWDLPVRRRGESCRELLQAAAEFLCWEFYDFGGKLYFGPPRPESEAVFEYDGPDGLTALRRWRTLAGQCGGVAVSGADGAGERLWSKTDRTADSGYGSDKMGSVLTGFVHTPESAVQTMAQAQYLSQARMEAIQRRGGGVSGRGVGIPELRPGRFVKLSGLSGAVNGSWYVRTVRHSLDAGGFETSFEAEE